MTTSKQITRFIKRSMFKGIDPYNSLDSAMQLRAKDNSRRSASRAKPNERDWRNNMILRKQAA